MGRWGKRGGALARSIVGKKFRRREVIHIQIALFCFLLLIAVLTSPLVLGDKEFPRIHVKAPRQQQVRSDTENMNAFVDIRIPFAPGYLRRSLGGETENIITSAGVNCSAEVAVPSSVDSYVQHFTREQLASGAIIVHILLMIYMFIGLAVVCDEYFESSLAAICEALNLKEDVAGATFMAAGGSAPELFTSIMGVAADSDIGFGTIVGSATFNVLFVLAACSFVTNNLALTWWPLTRDSVFYCTSIVVLVGCAINNEIDWVEAVVLMLFYALYITIMYYNERLEQFVGSHLNDAKPPTEGFRFKLYNFVMHDYFNYTMYVVILSNIVVIILDSTGSPIDPIVNTLFSAFFIIEMVLKLIAMGFFGYWKDALNAFDGILVILILVELFLSGSSASGGLRALRVFRFLRAVRALRIIKLYRMVNVVKVDASTQTENNDLRRPSVLEREGSHTVMPISALPKIGTFRDAMSAKGPALSGGSKVAPSQIKEIDDDEDDDEPSNPFEIPEGFFDRAYWLISFPLTVSMYLTIPDCRRPMFKQLYFVTFLMCIVWIALMAYVMVWMATIFGDFLGIPEPVMGLTLLAAGTSIPDLLSSVAVAKRGLGDMAVSSSIGSNVFDILVGLPVPWFFKTTIVTPGVPVRINSDGLTIMVLTLFIMVACVVSLIHMSKWMLTKRLGWTMIFLYVLFMTQSLLLEYGYIFSECGPK